ncbi:hypothetical protein FGB62_37g46 [Gracilaria domingensis]|nr:hypothetical protein FGB62_37g46 [Gracilaria domingensis]
MKRRMLQIENLVNTEAEQEYLLGTDDDDNWGVVDETEPLEPPPPESQPVAEPTSNVPASSQLPVAQSQPVVEPYLRDINVLLDIVEEHEPTGMNGWALVHREYNRYAEENHRARRAPDALKKKYDMLQYYQRRTGDSTCPDYVCRAKNIQKMILSKIVSLTYNSNLGDNIGLAATQILPAAGTCEEQTAGLPGQETTCSTPANDATQTVRRRQTSRSSYISLSARREIELNDSVKELANTVKEMAQLQNRPLPWPARLHLEIVVAGDTNGNVGNIGSVSDCSATRSRADAAPTAPRACARIGGACVSTPVNASQHSARPGARRRAARWRRTDGVVGRSRAERLSRARFREGRRGAAGALHASAPQAATGVGAADAALHALVLYEDENMLFVDEPSCIVCLPAPANCHGTLINPAGWLLRCAARGALPLRGHRAAAGEAELRHDGRRHDATRTPALDGNACRAAVPQRLRGAHRQGPQPEPA